MDQVLNLIPIVIFLVIAYGLYRLVRPHGTYRTEDNPYSRFCKACGQQQDFYAYSGDSRGWWEVMGKVKNPQCACHKDAEHHG